MRFALHDIIAVSCCSIGVGVTGQGQILAQKQDRVGEELRGHVGQVTSLSQIGPIPTASFAVVTQVSPDSAAAS